LLKEPGDDLLTRAAQSGASWRERTGAVLSSRAGRSLPFRWRIASALFLTAASGLWAQELPEGPGREETARLCKQCHELARSISLRQDRDGWNATINRMSAFGMKATPKELDLVVDYLAKNYPAEEIPRVNVNTASAIELESGLTLRRSQSAAIIQYREKNGPFKNLEDLKKVPNLDVEKIEAKKDRIAF
jgi:competence protein ComEA